MTKSICSYMQRISIIAKFSFDIMQKFNTENYFWHKQVCLTTPIWMDSIILRKSLCMSNHMQKINFIPQLIHFGLITLGMSDYTHLRWWNKYVTSANACLLNSGWTRGFWTITQEPYFSEMWFWRKWEKH